MSSIFSRIISGEIPCHKVGENDQFLAFLDIMPLKEGHVLVIPKREVDYIFDLDDEEYIALQLFAKQVAKAMKSVVSCRKIGVAVVGLEVPHAHIHLIPINSVADMNFANPKMSFSKEHLSTLAERIKTAFETL